ncbi:MAG: thiamine-phosphate kinase [Burkholderiales bacterium]|nr:thiamine-phosphate kinase [Burkholderiales bacterium]
MASEFELIDRYFRKDAPSALLGVGDDCALLKVDGTLAVSTDMLVSGTHFFPEDDPHLLGRKSLAVNVSDMAAMCARPKWATLALALPAADESWLKAFSRGFLEIASEYGVDLVGGDTTRGPLAICVQIMGEVQHPLRRDGARVGDDIWVSGTLGDAALGLSHLLGKIDLEEDAKHCLACLRNPVPRVELGLALSGISRCAIDISDGFCADLLHVLEASKVSAQVHLQDLPASCVLEKFRNRPEGVRAMLSGGDDYELCFTSPEEKREDVEKIGSGLGIRLTRVGKIICGSGLVLLDEDGMPMEAREKGYDHFR